MKKKAILMLLAATVVMNTMGVVPPSKQPSKARNFASRRETDTEGMHIQQGIRRRWSQDYISKGTGKSSKLRRFCYRNDASLRTGRSYCRICMAG